MGIEESKIPQHWNYFLALEEDLSRLSRYLELTQDNFKAYSLELARILFAAASEVDVVAKRLCERIEGAADADSINKYRSAIAPAYPEFATATVSLPKFGLSLTPWEQWGKDQNPVWWTAYNKVKHHRHTDFEKANLKNALNAVAGLFVLLLFFYENEAAAGGLAPDPTLFRAGPPFTVDRFFWGPQSLSYQRGGGNAEG
jgi:hypothetical protein